MNGWLLGVSPMQIGALRDTPSLASDVANVAQFDVRNSSADMREFEAQLAEAPAKVATLGPYPPGLGLGKSWHILHYLFTGDAWAASVPGDALFTGEGLGDDVGYGPARLHGVEETRDFAQFLQTVEVARLQERVDYEDMARNHIYGLPGAGYGPIAEGEREIRDEIAANVPLLKQYVASAAAARNGILVWLS